MATDETVTVSRDALRADLLALELRLTTWMGDQLALKANAADVAKLADATASMSRSLLEGEFTRAQENAIDNRVDAILVEKTNTSWTSRERRLALGMGAVTLMSCIASVSVAIHQINPFG